jgi:hypothetical protein
MNIIFLTMVTLKDVDSHGIYSDLMRKFRDERHEVYIVSPRERRTGESTHLYETGGVHVLAVRTLNLQKTNVIEKGIGQVLVETQFKQAIKKHLANIKVDLILYSTPPITFPKVIEYLKSTNPAAKTYLLLKDIFPQNAVDIGMMSATGLKGMLYKFFRKKEKQLYAISDHIGCMSPANVKYLLEHNPEITSDRAEVAPNSVAVPLTESAENADGCLAETAESADSAEVSISNMNATNSTYACIDIRKKYGLPVDKPVFIYGGNLGKPQGIPFLIQCLDANASREDCHFVVVGDGTEYTKLESWHKAKQPKSVSVFRRLPKEDYDQLVRGCDIGLIFLDYRFTIPNYPSRLLSYLIEKKPIIAATDPNCDTGSIAEANGYGYWCPSNDVNVFSRCVDRMLVSEIKEMGEAGYLFLLNNYTVEHTYNAIMKHFR